MNENEKDSAGRSTRLYAMKKAAMKSAAIAALLLFVSAADMDAAEPSQAGMQAMPAMPVQVFTAQQSDIETTLEYPARALSSGFVEVRAKVGGALLSREYKEGGLVAKDAVLFVIDPAKYQAAKDAAEASYNQARREYERAKKLFAQKAMSERDRDNALAAYETTRAALANAALDLGYTKVKAPIDGFAGQKALDNGNLISAGTLLTTITKTNPIYVEFAFSDFEALKNDYEIKGGAWSDPSAISVGVRSEGGVEYPNRGKLDFIDSSIDTNTGSVKARAALPNSMGYLMPGQYVRVVLSGIVKKDAVQIPSQALLHGPNGAFVYLIKEGKAAIQPVKIASEATGFFIIKEGLKSGDQIITNNLTKLHPGASVVAMPSAPAQGK